METPKQPKKEIRSRPQRRKKHDVKKWYNKWFKGTTPGLIKVNDTFGLTIEEIEAKGGLRTIMSNADRKKMGLPLDECQEFLQCDECREERPLYIVGNGRYECNECINKGLQNARTSQNR